MDELPRGFGQGSNLAANVKTNIEKPIQCPVVEYYKSNKGPGRDYEWPNPDLTLGIKFNAMVTLETLEKFWILSAVHHTKSVGKAAKMLGTSKESVYRKIRIWANEKK